MPSNCPDHPRELVPAPEGRRCPFCEGWFLSPLELETLVPDHASRLTLETRTGSLAFAKSRLCPDCATVMAPWRIGKLEAWVDRCPGCDGAWVERADRRSLAMLLKREQREKAWKSFSPAEREEMAASMVEKPPPSLETGVTAGEAVMLATGIPVLDRLEGNRFPWATLSLFVAIATVFLVGVGWDGWGFEDLGWRWDDGLSPRLLTSLFVHAGWAHLLGNAVFLLVFGHAVELKLSHLPVLGVFVGLGVAAALAEGVVQPHALIGGASGGISALMGLAVVVQPSARMKVAFFRAALVLSLPLWVMLGVDFAWQAALWALGVPGVAWAAHLAGTALGVALGFALRRRDAQKA